MAGVMPRVAEEPWHWAKDIAQENNELYNMFVRQQYNKEMQDRQQESLVDRDQTTQNFTLRRDRERNEFQDQQRQARVQDQQDLYDRYGAPNSSGRRSNKGAKWQPSSDDLGAVKAVAERIGASPEDLLTVMSYETGGSMSPKQWGGAGGKHVGLIQFGPQEQKDYGANPNQGFSEQLGAVERYLTARGYKPGMNMYDLYSTINAGSPGRYNASDVGNGGAPGTVRDKVDMQMWGHRQNAKAWLATLNGDQVPNAGYAVAPKIDPNAIPATAAPATATASLPNSPPTAQPMQQGSQQQSTTPPAMPQVAAAPASQSAPSSGQVEKYIGPDGKPKYRLKSNG